MARWWETIRAAGQARGWRARLAQSELSRRTDEVLSFLLARGAPGAVGAVLGWGVASELRQWVGYSVGAVMIVASLLHLLPGTTRAVLLWFGWWRLAGWHAYTDGWNWGRDRSGGRLVTLAIAHLRKPGDPALAAGLDAALAVVPRVGPGSVAAAGIRSFTAGDRADARRLWRLVAEFDASVRPPAVWVLAIDLLAAEAADSGELDRMVRELGRPRVPRTRLGDLLRTCARKVGGQAVPDGVLRGAWLLAGAWSRTAPLVARVRSGISRPGPLPVPVVDALLPAALIATARLGTAPQAPPRSEVIAAAERWDRVFGSTAEQARLRQRATAGADPVAALRGQVLDVLAERLEASPDPGLDDEGDGPLFREVVWRCADQRERALEWLADEIGNRTNTRRALPLLDEVRAWCRLIEAYEQVVAVSPERASASFPKLYHPVVRHTVWLHNERKQAPVANAMYRVELRFAERVAHDSGVALLTKNLACGP